MVAAIGSNSRSNSRRFGPISTFKLVTPVTLPPGVVEAGDKSDRNRVDCCRENDWDGRSRRLGRHCRRGAATRYNHVHLTANQFSRKRRKSIVLVFCPAIFDRDVLTLD